MSQSVCSSIGCIAWYCSALTTWRAMCRIAVREVDIAVVDRVERDVRLTQLVVVPNVSQVALRHVRIGLRERESGICEAPGHRIVGRRPEDDGLLDALLVRGVAVPREHVLGMVLHERRAGRRAPAVRR